MEAARVGSPVRLSGFTGAIGVAVLGEDVVGKVSSLASPGAFRLGRPRKAVRALPLRLMVLALGSLTLCPSLSGAEMRPYYFTDDGYNSEVVAIDIYITRRILAVGKKQTSSLNEVVQFVFDLVGRHKILTSLQPPGHPDASGTGTSFSGDGAVITGAQDSGASTYLHAFRWTEATGPVDLGTLDPPNNATTQSVGRDANTNGSVIAGFSGISGGGNHAFRWTQAGGMVDLGSGDGASGSSRAYGVSGSGSIIVGTSRFPGSSQDRVFRWTQAGGFQNLGPGLAYAITTDGSVIVGQSATRAFRWTQSGGLVNLGVLPGHMSSAALGVSENGNIVVGASSQTGLPGYVGNIRGVDEVARAFRWTAATGMQDLNQLLAAAGADLTGITLVAATAVSADGQWIAGAARTPDTDDPGETVAFIAQLCDAAIAGDCLNVARNDLLVDFGGSGLWERLNNTTWLKLHTASPNVIASGDLDGDGQDEAIASFSGSGLWARYNNTSWVRLHTAASVRFVAGDLDGNGKDDLAVDFGASGLWVRYNNTTWVKVHNLATQALAVGDFDGNGKADLLSDFGSSGLWVYNSAGWTRLHTLSPLYIATGDLDGNGKDELIADFGGTSPIWIRYNNASWVKLHNWLSQGLTTGDLDGSGKDDVLIDFGANGLWIRYNNATWTKLHNTSPVNITTADLDSNGKDDAVIDFGGSLGLYVRYNNATWTKLSTLPTQAVVGGGFD
jgi:probable HAF family extracellular repeat protein